MFAGAVWRRQAHILLKGKTMAAKPLNVQLNNARYLKNHASWLYCSKCNKTVAYLCYVTYSYFKFDFVCNCGSHGTAENCFEELQCQNLPTASLKMSTGNKRYCCANDEAPLFSVVEKNVAAYKATVVCKQCKTRYDIEKSE